MCFVDIGVWRGLLSGCVASLHLHTTAQAAGSVDHSYEIALVAGCSTVPSLIGQGGCAVIQVVSDIPRLAVHCIVHDVLALICPKIIF